MSQFVSQSMIEMRLVRVRSDCELIESDINLLAGLKKLNPMLTPTLDLRRSAASLRLAAQKLEDMANAADLLQPV